MKKKFPKKRRNRMKGRRNAGPVPVATRPRSLRSRIRRGAPPPWQTLAAAVGGSVGSAFASGLIASNKIAEPDTVAMLMAVGGGVAAYFTEGNTRVAATGVAAAGAGQYVLAKMYDAAVKKAERDAKKQGGAPAPVVAQLPAPPQQLPAVPPPAAVVPPRKSATGGGVVVELFRDAAADLAELEEEEWRYDTRDASADDDTPIEIDLDEAA